MTRGYKSLHGLEPITLLALTPLFVTLSALAIDVSPTLRGHPSTWSLMTATMATSRHCSKRASPLILFSCQRVTFWHLQGTPVLPGSLSSRQKNARLPFLQRVIRWRTVSWLLPRTMAYRSEEHTSELQSLAYLVCR